MNEYTAMLQTGWVQIAAAAVMAGMLLYGYRKGLVRMSVNAVSIVLSVIATKMLLPTVQGWIEANPALREAVAARVQKIAMGDAGAAESDTAAGANVDLFYQLLGLNKLTDYIADRITGMFLSAVTFILVLIITTILVKLVFGILVHIAELPVLSFFNRTLGAVLGLLEAVLYIWIFLIVISILPENPLTVQIAAQFNDPASWLFYLKEANIFVHIFEAIG